MKDLDYQIGKEEFAQFLLSCINSRGESPQEIITQFRESGGDEMSLAILILGQMDWESYQSLLDEIIAEKSLESYLTKGGKKI